MSCVDFKLMNGISLGFMCSVSSYIVSSAVFKNYQNFEISSKKWSYFRKHQLYWPLFLGFPVGFIVGYHQKPLLEIILTPESQIKI